MKPERHHIEPRQRRTRSPLLREVRSAERTESGRPIEAASRPIEAARGRPPEAAEEPMKCVWSGYPHYERDCRSRIPASIVVKAWQREMQLKGTQEGFFYFDWRSGVWLAFGTQDGSVRGVYCPTHCSERESREVQVEDRRAAQFGADRPGTNRSEADRPRGITLQ